MLVCVYTVTRVGAHVQVHSVHIHMKARSWCRASSLIAIHFTYGDRLSWTTMLSPSAPLDRQLALGILCLHTSRALGLQVNSGMQTPVFCPLSHPPVPHAKSLHSQSPEVCSVPGLLSTLEFPSEVIGQEGSMDLSWDYISHCEQIFRKQTAPCLFLCCVSICSSVFLSQ